MGFRFQKRIKILPGVTINLSKSGVSTSVGPRGAKLNFGKKGSKATVGLPGTGASYSEQLATTAPSASDQATQVKAGVGFGALLAGGIVLLFIFIWLFG